MNGKVNLKNETKNDPGNLGNRSHMGVSPVADFSGEIEVGLSMAIGDRSKKESLQENNEMVKKEIGIKRSEIADMDQDMKVLIERFGDYYDDLTPDNIANRSSPASLAQTDVGTPHGFTVHRAIDDDRYPGARAVSYVIAHADAHYPQHIHDGSDALFVIKKGSATLISGNQRYLLEPGVTIPIIANKLHGFEDISPEGLEFVSIQVPPIYNPETGEENLIEIKGSDMF